MKIFGQCKKCGAELETTKNGNIVCSKRCLILNNKPMKVAKKVSLGNWAKKGEDIKDGDAVEILDAGQEVPGDYGMRIAFKIKTRNGEKMTNFNQTSMNTLIDEYGDDTDKWIGNTIRVFMIKALVSGKMQTVAYFAPVGWDMADDGTFFKSGVQNAVAGQDEASDGISMDDIPL